MICDKCKRKTFGNCPTYCLIDPKINVGSGSMLKTDYINYDALDWTKYDIHTDIVDKIENVEKVLPLSYFSEVICFHVIEHFRMPQARNILKSLYNILRPGGKLILEAPDVLGSYWYFIEQKNNPRGFIDMLFSIEEVRLKYGEGMLHRSGWTKDIAEEEMENVGFKIVHKGIGLSHGMGKRDFRVEGMK